MRHLVVVVTGIGGSVLAQDGDAVWDAGVGDIVGLLARPAALGSSEAPNLSATGPAQMRDPGL